MISNESNSSVLCRNKKILKGIISKAIGLMFSKKITNIGYVFDFNKERRVDLHMFFVFFPIDVLFLDKNKRVVEIKENLTPFSIY